MTRYVKRHDRPLSLIVFQRRNAGGVQSAHGWSGVQRARRPFGPRPDAKAWCRGSRGGRRPRSQSNGDDVGPSGEAGFQGAGTHLGHGGVGEHGGSLTGDPTARRWAGGMQRGERSVPLAKIAVLHRTSCAYRYTHGLGPKWLDASLRQQSLKLAAAAIQRGIINTKYIKIDK